MRHTALLVRIALPVLIASTTAAAQQPPVGCDRVGTTSVEFGYTAGNLQPSAIELLPDGRLRQLDDERQGPVLGRVPRDSVRSLSRRAWAGGFAKLPPAPTRPGPNPDAARPYIELHSACGSHHVEYIPGQESRLFRELYARLNRLAALARQHR